MRANGTIMGLLIGAAAAGGCADLRELEQRNADGPAPSAMLTTEAPPSALTAAIAAYADTHPCEQRECWVHPRLSSSFSGTAGSSERDVWFAMNDGVMHFDGKEVQVHRLGRSGVVWASAPDDMWIVNGTSIARWDGKTFSVVREGAADDYRGVWGTSRNNVYVSGFEALIHWDGSNWTQVDEVTGIHIAGSAADDVWVGYRELAHFDGRSWSHLALPKGMGSISDLSVSGPRDVWMVTSFPNAELWHFDGTNWVAHGVGERVSFDGVSAQAADDVWAFGKQDGFRPALFHYDGRSWTRGPALPTRLDSVVRVGGIDYATGAGRIYRIDRAPLGVATLTPGTTAELTSNWGTSSRDMWAVGERGTALHYDGEVAQAVDTGVTQSLRHVAGAASDDVWAVGTAGTVLHWDGSAWTLLPSGSSATLHHVFTRARDDAWVGGDGVLLHASKAGVTKVVLQGQPAGGSFIAIDGSAPDDVWALGNFGNRGAFVTHYDGTTWSPVQTLRHSQYDRPARAIIARSSSDVWIDTPYARDFLDHYFWHWDGKTWSFVGPGGSEPWEPRPSFPSPWSFVVDGKTWSVGTYGRWSYRQ